MAGGTLGKTSSYINLLRHPRVPAKYNPCDPRPHTLTTALSNDVVSTFAPRRSLVPATDLAPETFLTKGSTHYCTHIRLGAFPSEYIVYYYYQKRSTWCALLQQHRTLHTKVTPATVHTIPSCIHTRRRMIYSTCSEEEILYDKWVRMYNIIIIKIASLISVPTTQNFQTIFLYLQFGCIMLFIYVFRIKGDNKMNSCQTYCVPNIIIRASNSVNWNNIVYVISQHIIVVYPYRINVFGIKIYMLLKSNLQ